LEKRPKGKPQSTTPRTVAEDTTIAIAIAIVRNWQIEAIANIACVVVFVGSVERICKGWARKQNFTMQSNQGRRNGTEE